jgi:tetratricopeptide (TPR) repeat protein
MGVFVGGCTIEAAEAVCAAVVDGESLLALDGIESLVSKSLLRQEDGPDGEPRFQMMETIREFALEQLAAAGETASLRRQHAIFFLSLAEQADAQLSGPRQLPWLERLDAENDNLRAALNWSLAEPGEAETASRLAVALFWFWTFRSHVMEMRDWLTRALERSAGANRTLLRARLLTRLAVAGWQRGEFSAARDWLDESVALCRELGATQELAFALFFLGNVAMATGDPATAEVRYGKSLAVYRKSGDPRGLSQPLLGLGRVALERGNLESAQVYLDECLTSARLAGEPFGMAQALNSLGDVARRQGDYGRARARYEEGLAQFLSLGTRWSAAGLLHNLGYVSLYQQDATRAAELFAESLTLFREAGDRRGLAECLAGLAGVAAVGGQPARAARLFGASEALLEAIDTRLSPSNLTDYERNLDVARSGLDEAAFTAAWSEGRAMPPDQAVTYALEEPALT